MTSAIATGLIHVSGDRAAPGALMSLAAMVGLVAVLLIGRKAPSPRTGYRTTPG